MTCETVEVVLQNGRKSITMLQTNLRRGVGYAIKLLAWSERVGIVTYVLPKGDMGLLPNSKGNIFSSK